MYLYYIMNDLFVTALNQIFIKDVNSVILILFIFFVEILFCKLKSVKNKIYLLITSLCVFFLKISSFLFLKIVNLFVFFTDADLTVHLISVSLFILSIILFSAIYSVAVIFISTSFQSFFIYILIF